MKPKLGEGSTPGPWSIERPYQEKGLFVSATNPRYTNPLICRVKDTPEGLANACLIAKAPLLIETRDMLKQFTLDGRLQTYIDRELFQVVARALLARLESEDIR
jgi:hypothetical protein